MKIILKAIVTIIVFGFTSLYAQQQPTWTVELEDIGTFSSPRVTDLNGDGVKDIILGAGREEFEQADTAVIALDGTDGSMLWYVSARDQMFGSATLKDINGDGTEDAVISGRSAELKAINGRTGELLWEFTSIDDSLKRRELGYWNFYNPQFIEDQNKDGFEDILVANGGDVTKLPNDPDRPPGQLFILDGKTGAVISRAMMPDDKEIYMSALVTKLNPGDKNHTVIFGTGGETVGGSLYRCTLKEVRKNDLSKAVKLATSDTKGFIAPPMLVDINRDGTLDIVANAVDGRMIRIDGATDEIIWQSKTPGSEAYASIAGGYFFDKEEIDFFSIYAQGIWPNLTKSKQRLVDAQTGTVIFSDSIGSIQTSTPVIADITQDGFEDALFSANVFVRSFPLREYFNVLILYDFKNKNIHQFTRAQMGVNLASTPWIGDLDGNGKFDIIYCNHTESRNIFSMKNLRVNLIKTDLQIKKEVKWGSYMGSDYDGIRKD